MASISSADSVYLHEYLARGPDHATAIIAASAAILASAITGLIALRAQRAEHKRWLGTFFLTRKQDTLAAIWFTVAEWHDVLTKRRDELVAGNYDEATAEPIAPLENACIRALRVAQPYLEDDEFRSLKELTNRLLLVRLQVVPSRSELAAEQHKQEWDQLDASYDRAVGIMRGLFGQPLLERVIPSSR